MSLLVLQDQHCLGYLHIGNRQCPSGGRCHAIALLLQLSREPSDRYEIQQGNGVYVAGFVAVACLNLNPVPGWASNLGAGGPWHRHAAEASYKVPKSPCQLKMQLLRTALLHQRYVVP